MLPSFSASIQALLSAPNPDDPLSENIAKHWKSNEAEAVETGNVDSFPFYWFYPHLARTVISINNAKANLFFLDPCSKGMDPFICEWCVMAWCKFIIPSNNIIAMYGIHCHFR